MISISLCMIVKNEEATLGRCLDTVKEIVDEIIIVDTGSTDRTKEIAGRYTGQIYDFKWVDDFSAARNEAFSKATKDYIMWLDADDVLLESDRLRLKQLKEKLDTSTDVVYMKYNLSHKALEGNTYTFWRERLVKRACQFRWKEPVHEYIDCKGKMIKIDIAVTHKKEGGLTRRNLEIFEKYIASGKELSPRNLYYYGRELYAQGERDKGASYYEAYLETTGGVLSTRLEACMTLSKYYEGRKEDEKALRSLIRYFEFDGPRAEICCQLGYYYKTRKEYDKAIGWFQMAPFTPRPVDTIGLVQNECWDYVPFMELCACYFQKGNLPMAIFYNEKAASARPNDEKVIYNRFFLASEKKRREELRLQEK